VVGRVQIARACNQRAQFERTEAALRSCAGAAAVRSPPCTNLQTGAIRALFLSNWQILARPLGWNFDCFPNSKVAALLFGTLFRPLPLTQSPPTLWIARKAQSSGPIQGPSIHLNPKG